MNRPLFSIVIPTYNRAALIGRCLESVIAQTYSNWEAIIVDNFSEDNTEEIVLSYKDDRIKFVKNHNYGIISVSRNKAISLANGDWICFLDSDDFWLPNKLEIISKYTEKYDLIYHEYQLDINSKKLFKNLTSYSYSVGNLTVSQVMRRGDPMCPSCTAVSKQAMGNIRFSEDKALFAVEDYDFFLQLIERRLKIKYIRKALTIYNTNGVSQGRIALDRDRKIYIKYMDKLSRTELREIIKYYYYRKACYFNHSGTYNIAIKYLSIAATSKDWYMKTKALKSIIKSSILYVFDKHKIQKNKSC